MKHEETRAPARSLMDASGLVGWRFRFDRARCRVGACTRTSHAISLSGPPTDLCGVDTIRGIVLHEIVHAPIGPSHGHDAVWKRVAYTFGVPDSAQLPSFLSPPDASQVGTCLRCGATRRPYRTSKCVSSYGVCSRAFNPALILMWERRGKAASLGCVHEHELASIRCRQRYRRQLSAHEASARPRHDFILRTSVCIPTRRRCP